MIWTIVEPGLGITAASAVTLRPLLRACKIKGFSSDYNGDDNDQTPSATGVSLGSSQNWPRGDRIPDGAGDAAGGQYMRSQGQVLGDITSSSTSATESMDRKAKLPPKEKGARATVGQGHGDTDNQDFILLSSAESGAEAV